MLYFGHRHNNFSEAKQPRVGLIVMPHAHGLLTWLTNCILTIAERLASRNPVNGLQNKHSCTAVTYAAVSGWLILGALGGASHRSHQTCRVQLQQFA